MPDHPDPCPLCDPRPIGLDDERASRWFEAGHLCREHTSRACLPDGQPLVAYVGSAPFQLEGSLLGYVLNPLTVDGRPAWSMWAAGGYGVWDELFPSQDFSEFQAQHFPDGLQVLHDLHVHRDVFGTEVTFHGVYNYGLAVFGIRPRWSEQLHLSCHFSRNSDRYADLRAAMARRLPSPQELVDAVIATPSPEEPMPSEEFLRRVQALLALAERRFPRHSRPEGGL